MQSNLIVGNFGRSQAPSVSLCCMKTQKRGEREKKIPRMQIRQDLARNLLLELARLYPQVETKTERILLLEKHRGFPHSTTARILNGEKSPLVDNLDELAECLGIPAYRLLLPAERPPERPSRDLTDTTVIQRAPVFDEPPALHAGKRPEDRAIAARRSRMERRQRKPKTG